MDIIINCRSAVIQPINVDKVSVSIDIKHASDALCEFSFQDILDNFDNDELLDLIGKEKVKSYFDLIENPD